MTDAPTLETFGVLTEPATLKIQRLLPGPIERIWSFLTDSERRRQWLAAGKMEMKAGAPFEWVWRNDELTDPPGKRPDGFGAEHRMKSRIVAIEPPRRLTITWGESGEVSFALDPVGGEVLLTIVHRRLPDRASMLNVSAGWHAHLDILAARVKGEDPGPFWDHWSGLKRDYDKRLPA